MADQSGSRPPSAPLSAEDADRLAASFTPSWEEDPNEQKDSPSAAFAAPSPFPAVAASPALPPAPTGLVGPAMSTGSAGPELASVFGAHGFTPAPGPSAPVAGDGPPLNRPTNKQTLLGMSPFGAESRPRAPSPTTVPPPQSASSAVSTQPFPALSLAQAAAIVAERPSQAPTHGGAAEPTKQAAPVATTQPIAAVPATPKPIAHTEPIPVVPAPELKPIVHTEPIPVVPAPQPKPIAHTEPIPVVPAPEPKPPAHTEPIAANPVPPNPGAAMPPIAAVTAVPSGPSASTQSLPAEAAHADGSTGGPVRARGKHHQTLLGYAVPIPDARSAPVGAETRPRLASESPAAAPSPVPNVPSSIAVPGYAIAYTPKDDPSTPAVVIAPDAQSRPVPQQAPSRSLPSAAPAPALPTAPITDDVDMEQFLPKRRNRSLIAVAIAVPVLLLGSVLGFRALSDGSGGTAPSSSSEAPPTPPAAAPTAPAPAIEESGSRDATIAPQPAATEPEPKARTRGKAKPERPAVATPAARPAARPSRSPASAPSEPKAAPSKGVIVRDAPF